MVAEGSTRSVSVCYEKISTSVQVATHTFGQQNSNFRPILGESSLRLILVLYFLSTANVNR